MSLYYKDIEENALREFEAVNSKDSLEAFNIKYLGRKGIITELISNISSLPAEDRPAVGKELNILKNKLKGLIDSKQNAFSQDLTFRKSRRVDVTLPGFIHELGRKHPLTQTMDEICQVFVSLGFKVFEGPEIETERNNFQALNIPLEHPSCDAFDTFYIDSGQITDDRGQKNSQNYKLLLRSHTSPGQIHVMSKYKPPVAAIVPGKVYRPDATDASHSFMFHQVEGFFVDKDVKFSDLKGVLEEFSKEMFGQKTKMRFRPHFFPFTEPSAEVDISCIICRNQKPCLTARQAETRGQKKCSVCGGKGWLEILGCGMVHPNVFKAVGYPDGEFTGFAFGMGVERITMLKYGIDDIRIFFENDLRFLKQF
jgi:phenylalanyl-tRNA synthetase alpha chain